MKIRILVVMAFVSMINMVAHAQSSDNGGIKRQRGPSVGNLGGKAEVRVPAGYFFVGADDTRKVMELMKNPISGVEMGLVAPDSNDWFVIFEFDDVGYVRDNEKNSLDADAMLESIKKGTATNNKERQRRGWPTMKVLGWEQKPHYNESTHNLEWATRLESEGHTTINFNTRLLGRDGVMRVTFVIDPTTLSKNLPKFKKVLAGFNFIKGHKYAEFKQGDKIAKYGLAALITGGAAAVAVKTGLFKWIWKGIVMGVLAIGSLFKFLKNRLSRDKSQ